MKKTLAVILSAVLLLALAVPASGITVNGHIRQTGRFTVVSPQGSENAKAAEYLAEYLSEITGSDVYEQTSGEYEIPDYSESYIIEVGAEGPERDILLGNAPDGSYIIEPTKNGCAIYGAGKRGTANGVFGLLKECFGCSFYTAEGMTINKNAVLKLPEQRISYVPAFEYTDTDWASPRDELYSVANGLTGGVYRDISDDLGGTVDYISSFCHTMTTEFCSAEKYFGEHPEYFALHNGSRSAQQLCLSNEDVYEIVLSEVLDLLKEKHDPDAALQIVSLTQNDSGEEGDFCECDACRATDEKNGSHAGTMITFVNRIARAVKEKGYNNIAIDTFAYRYTRKAPTEVIPEDNVIVRLCTIECCFTHTLDDESCEQNVKFTDDLKAWNKICSRLYIWDYVTNFAFTAGIFPDFNVIDDNMRIFAENGVKGVYEEGNYYVSGIDTEFSELRAYLLSRLLRDPYCDYESEMNAFCRAYYGEGGEAIADFVTKISETASRVHGEIYSPMSDTFSEITDEEISEFDGYFAEAKEKAKDNETALSHIQRSELSWRYVKSSLCRGEFRKLTSRSEENKRLYADIIASGATRLNEGGGEINPLPLYSFLPADGWCGGNDRFSDILNIVANVICGLAFLFAVLTAVAASKKKNYFYFVLVPVFIALLIITGWNRRAYLAWKDIDQYAISSVLLILLAALTAFMCCAVFKNSKKKKAVTTLVLTAVFAALYELPLLIINVLMYNGTANLFSFTVSMLLISVFLLALTAAGLIKTKKREN